MSTPASLILVIEDEAEIRHVVRAALEAEGWRVCEADSMAPRCALAQIAIRMRQPGRPLPTSGRNWLARTFTKANSVATKKPLATTIRRMPSNSSEKSKTEFINATGGHATAHRSPGNSFARNRT